MNFEEAQELYQPGECFAPDCGEPIAREYLMCSRHWYQVPTSIRSKVWSALRRYGALSERWWQAVIQARESLQ